VWLVRDFLKLSKDVKFTKFGSVFLKLLNFEIGTSKEFVLKLNSTNSNSWAARENLLGRRGKNELGQPSYALARSGPTDNGVHLSAAVPTRNGTQ
jgi:hypothetical protein